MASELRFERTIQASPEQVYRMFTNGVAMREWACDYSLAYPTGSGLFYAGWHDGGYVSGRYTAARPNEAVELTWQGRDDPGPTWVQVSIAPSGEGAHLSLVHSGFGSGEDWERVCQTLEQGWTVGLNNLVSALETGQDPRIVNRPMIGVLFNTFDEAEARKLGLPVSRGLRLDGTIEGMAAHKAGLLKDDVLVEMNGIPVADYSDTSRALQGKRAGDRVEVVFYRGPEKMRAEMELSRRPIPEMPADASAFARAMEKIFQEDLAGVEQALAGVSEAESSFRPGPGAWSARDVLAHLLQVERQSQLALVAQINSQGYPEEIGTDNLDEAVQATAETYGTTAALLEGLRRAQAETVALLARLPERFVARKSSMWRMAFYQLSFPYHGRDHVQQIQEAVATARKA
jgi:uncharacterized protein YndB with AHSA1/START domain